MPLSRKRLSASRCLLLAWPVVVCVALGWVPIFASWAKCMWRSSQRWQLLALRASRRTVTVFLCCGSLMHAWKGCALDMGSRVFAAALWADSWDKVFCGSDACVQGVASFDDEKGIEVDLPLGELLADAGTIAIGDDSLPDKLDWLYGFSQEGCRFALSGVVSAGTARSYPGGSHQTLRATRLLYSKSDFDPAERVSKVVLEIRGLSEWLGISPVRRVGRPGKGSSGFSVEVDLDGAGNQVLFENDELKFTVSHAVNSSGSPESGYKVDHRCLLAIDFIESKTLVDAQDMAFWIADFFSFCFGFHAEIDEMRIKFGDALAAYCLVPLVKGYVPKTIVAHRMVLPYREISDKLGGILSAWVNAESDLHSPASLLTTLMTKNWVLPIDLKFIAAAQMLEALSRVGADLKSLSEEDYKLCKSALAAALDGIGDCHIRSNLKNRLNLGDRKGQNRLLTELVDRHAEAAGLLFGDSRIFVKRHTDLRNGITHRNGGVTVSNEDLYWHTEGVLIFAYCVVGELLGIPPGEMERRIEVSAFRCNSVSECRRMYPKKKEVEVPV